MVISDIRTLFKERSGDLNMTDADIDRHINNGIQLLDMLTQYSHAPAKHYAELVAGSYRHTFNSVCRAVKEVWIIDSADGRSKLEKVTLSALREQYPDVPDTDAGKPLYYANAINRSYPETFDETTLSAEFRDHIDTSITAYNIDGILFMPPTDETYVIEVIGKFHSPALSDAVMQNWWSVNYDEAVLLAALHKLETFYRNSEGAADYMRTLSGTIKGISDDKAEEDAQDYSVMIG